MITHSRTTNQTHIHTQLLVCNKRFRQLAFKRNMTQIFGFGSETVQSKIGNFEVILYIRLRTNTPYKIINCIRLDGFLFPHLTY